MFLNSYNVILEPSTSFSLDSVWQSSYNSETSSCSFESSIGVSSTASSTRMVSGCSVAASFTSGTSSFISSVISSAGLFSTSEGSSTVSGIVFSITSSFLSATSAWISSSGVIMPSLPTVSSSFIGSTTSSFITTGVFACSTAVSAFFAAS